MRLAIYSFCTALLLQFVQCSPAEETPEMFAWRQPIIGGGVSGRLYRMSVPPEVFDGCHSFPADLRIFDDDRKRLPFFIWSPPYQDRVTPVFVTKGPQSGGANGSAVVQPLTLRSDVRGGAVRHNQMSIFTGGHDFVRRVEILGSEDGVSWKEVGSGVLIDKLQESGFKEWQVSYPETTLPRLMLRIHPNGPAEKERIEILNVEVGYRAHDEWVPQKITLKPLPVATTELTAGILTVVFDTGAQNRPLSQMNVQLKGGDFVFPVKVFGRNSADMKWQFVSDGGIYRIGKIASDTIDLKDAGFRQLKLEILHGNEPAPIIASATADTELHIIFESQGGANPALHYGADRMPLPRYDLMLRTTGPQIGKAMTATVGKAHYNPLKVASGLARFGKTLAWLVGSFTVVLVMFLVFRGIRPRL